MLEQGLEIPTRKFDHASLYGRLVMEWLGAANTSPLASVSDNDADSFEHLGRKEMYDQRKEWETIVFANDSKSDPDAIEAYLSDTFGSTSKAKKLTKSPLETLKEKLGSFHLGDFDVDVLKTCITGVLGTDLLSRDKRTTLSEFASNKKILHEIVDVLNMQIDAIDTWNWGPEAVALDVRRALNGKYRVYMDEEILQALLLHFIGLKWAVHFKSAFLEFFNSGAWKQSSRSSMDRQARQRRQDFLGEEKSTDSTVRNERRSKYQAEYFMLQLPDSFNTTTNNYNGTSDDASDDGHNGRYDKAPTAMKQSLLHLLSTESLLNTRLYGSFTILQSDFKWFGPSMPHATIMAVLRFLGVPERWLKFFTKFLEAPVKFAMDGPEAQTKIRRSGIPIQHRLSDALSEAVLFSLDFAVNKSTESNLYRLHDDIWFWGDKDATIKAWKTIKHFASVTGLRLNESKTGAIELSGTPIAAREFSPSDDLPSGPITWGFLKIGPSGSWIVNDEQIDRHAQELRVQLGACKSIFAWVHAWNTYVARFLPNNFGEPANCLGRPHIDMVIEAFETIQGKLFGADGLEGNNAIEHLRRKLSTLFGVTDVPDGFFTFPVQLGGLDLQNPLIPLFIVRPESFEDPLRPLERAIEDEEAKYERAKKSWEDGNIRPTHRTSFNANEDFMSLDEYLKYLEETSASLRRSYSELMDPPDECYTRISEEISNAQLELPTSTRNMHRGDEYYDWVQELYGPEIIKKYGGLAMGDARLLPIGLVDMLKSEKIRWKQ